MREKLESFLKETLKEKYNFEDTLKIEVPDIPEYGDFALPCFQFAKLLRKAPPMIASDLKATLDEKNEDFIQEIVAMGPYLNFKINKGSYFSDVCLKVLNSDTEYGKTSTNEGKTVMVEFSSPNTNKPQHLGHIRNNILGDSVSNLLGATGHKVIKANLLNDRGIHICKAMVAWKNYGNGETPESSGIKGDHLIGKYYVIFEKKLKEEQDEFVKNNESQLSSLSDRERDKFIEDNFYPISKHLSEAREMLVKWENNDPQTIELWKKLNSWVFDGFNETYKALRIKFDKFYYESDTYKLGKDHVLAGLEKGVCYQKEDGSIWIRLEDKKFSNDKLLLRRDGTSVYMTQDIGTAFLKYNDFKMDKSVYVVGSEQEYHFQVLFKSLELLGFEKADGCHHLSYGMIYLPEGRMKSREGKVVDADDLVLEMKEKAKEEISKRNRPFSGEELDKISEIVALGALKYFVLQYSAKTDFVFDPNASIDFNGKTGPYIQYTHARISSLVKTLNITDFSDADFSKLSSNEDLNLLRLLEQFPYVVEKSSSGYNTSGVAEYLYDLASSFNSFYSKSDNRIKEMSLEEQKPRVALSKACAIVIRNGLKLLGIEAPEQM